AHRAQTDVSNVGHSFHPDRLYIRKLPDPVNSKLTPVARGFYTAERHSRIGNDHLIDKNHSCVDLIFESFSFIRIIGPGTGPQPKPGIIRKSNGFADVLDAKDGGYGAEEFFLICRRIPGNVRENGRLVVVARPLNRPASDQNAGAG